MAEDLFADALNIEEQLYEEGYKEGFADGAKAGKIEGRSFGMAKGFDKFMEAGKLYGKSVVWANQLPPAAIAAATNKPKETVDPRGGPAQEGEAEKCTLPPLPNNTRLAKNVIAIHALTEPDTLSTENNDEAVQDVDDRVRKAQGKAKVVERMLAGKHSKEEEGSPA